jgi:hypothetical protein
MADGKWQRGLVLPHHDYAQAAKILMESSTARQSSNQRWPMANDRFMLGVIVLNRYGLAGACLHGVRG